MKNWYAVYTRPQQEKKIADTFLKRKIESYCPLHKQVRLVFGRKTSPVALFPGYVFVRATESELAQIRRTDGVINLVYWLGKPVVVRDIEVEMLQRFLSVHTDVQVEKTSVDMAAMVTLTETPPAVLQKQDGGMVAVGASGAKLLLPTLGYRLCANPQNQLHTVALTLNALPKQQDILTKTS